jgi:hypothetical protein
MVRVWPGDLLTLANGHICQFWRWHHYFVDRARHRPGAGGTLAIAWQPQQKGGANAGRNRLRPPDKTG